MPGRTESGKDFQRAGDLEPVPGVHAGGKNVPGKSADDHAGGLPGESRQRRWGQGVFESARWFIPGSRIWKRTWADQRLCRGDGRKHDRLEAVLGVIRGAVKRQPRERIRCWKRCSGFWSASLKNLRK